VAALLWRSGNIRSRGVRSPHRLPALASASFFFANGQVAIDRVGEANKTDKIVPNGLGTCQLQNARQEKPRSPTSVSRRVRSGDFEPRASEWQSGAARKQRRLLKNYTIGN